MMKSIGVLLCIFALSVAALPAAFGMEHDHGGAGMAMTMTEAMDEHRSGGHPAHDPAKSNHCEIVPAHCSFLATPDASKIRAAHYVSNPLPCRRDDRAEAKYRPETELRPPRV